MENKKHIPSVSTFTAILPTSIEIFLNIPLFYLNSAILELLKITVIKLQYLFISLSCSMQIIIASRHNGEGKLAS